MYKVKVNKKGFIQNIIQLSGEMIRKTIDYLNLILDEKIFKTMKCQNSGILDGLVHLIEWVGMAIQLEEEKIKNQE